MSGTIEVPKGLDKLTKDEERLFDQMRSDDAGAEPEPAPAARPAPVAAPEAAAPAPEAAEAPEEDDGEAAVDPRTRTVPHQQFHAERERRKAAEAKAQTIAQEAAADRARLQERVNLITAAVQASTQAPPAAPAAEEPLPDVNVDPVAHFRVVAERQAKQIEALTGMVSGFNENQQRVQQNTALRDWGAAQERAFSAKEPDYGTAMEHLRQSRREELGAIGVADPAEQERIIGMDIHAIAVRSQREGVDFAERLFTLAQKRGFQKKAPVAAAAAAPAVGIPPLDAAVTIPDPVAARMQAGRDNATTIGTAGSAPPTRLSVAKIADMSEGQFAALMARMKDDPEALHNLMGA